MEASARRTTLIDAVVPGTGLLRDAALIAGFVLLVAVFAQIRIQLPFTAVPITGQTLGVLLTGGALGARRGAAALGLYALIGSMGAPVFTPTEAALDGRTFHFVFPWLGTGAAVWTLTGGGYILGFIAAAYVVGRLAEHGWDRRWRVVLAMAAGNILIYVPGLLWLGFAIWSGVLDAGLGFELAAVIPGETVLQKTLVGGLYPFIPGDIFKLAVAAAVLPGAWALIGRGSGRQGS